MKKIVRVPVGKEPKIAKYRYGGSEYITYEGYGVHMSPESNLKRLISELNSVLVQHRDRYSNMAFHSIRDCYCPHDCSCSPSYVLYGERYETDIEYQFRMKQEEEQKRVKEDRELALFKELSKKYSSN